MVFVAVVVNCVAVCSQVLISGFLIQLFAFILFAN